MMESTNGSEWQAGKSLALTNKHMLENQVACDIKFMFPTRDGTTGISLLAHRYMLMSRSAVFEAMLTGEFRKAEALTIADIEAEVFMEMLRYMYTEECDISAENVLHLMFAASQYNIWSLVKECKETLQKEINHTNVCTVLNHAHYYEEPDLVESCLNFIRTDTEAVFKDSDFLGLSDESLELILKTDDIFLGSEMEVLKACVRWANHQEETEPTGRSIRQVLGLCLYQIRFCSMTSAEFVSAVEEYPDLFAESEENAILHYFVRNGEASRMHKQRFNTTKRQKQKNQMIPISSLSRFGRTESSTQKWGYDGKKSYDEIVFTVDKPIQITGVGLYGGYNAGDSNSLHLTLNDMENNEQLVEHDTDLVSVGKSEPIVVKFETPVLIAAGQRYHIKVLIGGPTTFYGKDGKETVEAGGVMFNFSDGPQYAKRTSTHMGQLPQILFSLS